MKENQALLRFSFVHFDILATITIIYNNVFGNRERKRKEEVLSTVNNKVEKYDALNGMGLDLSRHGESSHHGCSIFTYFHAYIRTWIAPLGVTEVLLSEGISTSMT